MKHYSAEQWIDFVNGASAKSALQEMQKHLDSRLQANVQGPSHCGRRFGSPPQKRRILSLR